MAAVVSVLMAAPRNTPCCQPKLSKTMGMTFVRRDPKMKPDSGTPFGSSQLGAMEGHWLHGVVKRELGCAAGAPPGVHGLPCQSTVPAGAAAPMPSHQGSLVGVDPGDVVAERPRAVPGQLRHDHGEIGLAGGARHGAPEVRDPALGVLHAQDEHMLGHPAFLVRLGRPESQRVALFSEKSVAAIARAHAPDELLLREVEDESTLR